MLDSLYIAWRSVSFNKAKTAPLVVCVALILALPAFLHLLSQELERQALSHPVSVPATATGGATPVVVEAAPSGSESGGSTRSSGDAGRPAVNAGEVNRLIGSLFFIVVAVVVLLLGLALRVSLLLRAKEMFALYKLGCPRAMMARQVVLEVLMVALAGGALCSVLLLVAHYYAGGLVDVLIGL